MESYRRNLMATLHIRGVPEGVAREFRAEAALRGLKLAEFLALLVRMYRENRGAR
jgi:hypothetical protein